MVIVMPTMFNIQQIKSCVGKESIITIVITHPRPSNKLREHL